MIVGVTQTSSGLLASAIDRTKSAYRPSTIAAHTTHFRTFIAFLLFLSLAVDISVHNVLIFLEYLYTNNISPRVIKNYLSSMISCAKHFRMDPSSLFHPLVNTFIRSVSINSTFAPSTKGIFDINTLYLISLSCDILSDPLLFRAIFLTSFYAFLRMSNVAPHSASKFDPPKHFLRRDLVFAPPGAHLILKWSKTLQDHKSHHVVQIPEIKNPFLCPIRALKALLKSRKLPSVIRSKKRELRLINRLP